MLNAYHEWAERDHRKNTSTGAKSQRNRKGFRASVIVCDSSLDYGNIFFVFLAPWRETVSISQQNRFLRFYFGRAMLSM